MTGIDKQTVLVTLTGRDKPGVMSAVFDVLAAHAVDVIDVEQVVLRGRLLLGVLVTSGPDQARLREDIFNAGAALGFEIEIRSGTGDNPPRLDGRSHVTVLGHPLRPAAVAAVAGRIADLGANIDRIVRLARDPVTVLELGVSGGDPGLLRSTLARVAVEQAVDVAVQPSGLYRRAKRLVVLDVDSTLIQGEVIEMLASHTGCEAEVARITEAAMRGELEFEDSLRQRVELLAGAPASALDSVREQVRLTPGAETLIETLQRLGYQIALVSGGFTEIVEPIARSLGITMVAANGLEVADGALTGKLAGPVVDREGKAHALRAFAGSTGTPLAQTVAIGDGANDLGMLELAGLGVAFNAKPVVQAAADTSLNVPYLDAILYLLGITHEEIETT